MASTDRDKSKSEEPDDQPEEAANERAETADADFNHPKALTEPIALIKRLLAEGADPKEGIQQLCARAMANPDACIEAAGNYLAHLITGGQLAGCPDIPTDFLVEELAQEAAIVSPLLISRWEESGDPSRLLRFADGLIAQAVRMKGADVGSFILDVAVKIAIQKPVRSRRLIEIGRGLVEDTGNNPQVARARQWLAAGDFLRESGAAHRSFWLKRLADETKGDWESAEAQEAVSNLKKARAKGKKIPPLLLDAIPPETGSSPAVDEQAASKIAETTTASDESDKTSAPAPGAEKPKATHERIYKPESQQKPRVGFLPGFLIGGVTMLAVAAWIWKSVPKPGPQAPPPPVVATKAEITAPVQAAAPVPSQPAAAVAPEPPPPARVSIVEKKEVPAPKPEVPVAASPPVMVAAIKPMVESPPVLAVPPPVSPAAPEHPNDGWRKTEFAQLARQHPSLVRWHAQARTSTWSSSQALLLGRLSFLPYAGDEFPHLLTLLLLDPPRDAEVAEAVPKIAARRMKTAEFVTLWEKLVYPGSPNEKQVRAAAEAYLSVRADSLTPSMIARLQKVARPAIP